MTESNSGTLYVVATPIGNLDDFAPRAQRTLAKVALIAAEDTRHTARLLNHLGLERPIMSLHEHNEAQRVEQLVGHLEAHRHEGVDERAAWDVVAELGRHAPSERVRALVDRLACWFWLGDGLRMEGRDTLGVKLL